MIILNCPANCDIPEGYTNESGEFIITGYDDRNYCEKYKKNCAKVNNCVMKQIADKLNCFWCDAVGKSYDEEEREAYINEKIANIFDLFEIEGVRK